MRWLAALVLLAACEAEPPETPPAAPPTTAPPVLAPSAAPVPSAEKPAPSCAAPSLAHDGPLDARHESALAECVRPSTGPGRAARQCGQESEVVPIDRDRLAAAVLLDDATAAHIKTVAARGKTLARRADVFGLVGDSMTVSGAFLRAPPSAIDPDLDALLRDASGGSIVDVYAGAEAVRVRGLWRDAFGAPRAAKIGAGAAWVSEGGAASPLMQMVNTLSPAVAVVLFGGNDAASSSYLPLADLTDRFDRDLSRIIDTLEAEGIIVVLNTLARHGNAPGFEDCLPGRELSNWRIAVQTNALSARVAEIACRRHLPLIDVRDALDTAVNRGLGPDQVHPSAYEKGPDILDNRGMRCGYNVRSFVTLLMLRRIHERVFGPLEIPAGNPSPKQ